MTRIWNRLRWLAGSLALWCMAMGLVLFYGGFANHDPLLVATAVPFGIAAGLLIGKELGYFDG